MTSALIKQAASAAFFVLLAACSALPDMGEGKHPPKWKPSTATHFGDWFTEPATCVLGGNSPEVRTTTTGAIENGTIELRMFFSQPLARQPRAALNQLPVGLRMEGANQSYTLQLPYSPSAVMHYMQTDSFLTITYQPAASDSELEVNFGTDGLVSGVTYLSRACHN